MASEDADADAALLDEEFNAAECKVDG